MSDRPTVEYRGTGFYVGVIAAIVITAGLLVLAVQNTASVTVEWLWFEISAPLFAWIIGAALLAVAVDEIVGVVWRARARTRLSRIAARAEPDNGGPAAPAETTPADPEQATLERSGR